MSVANPCPAPSLTRTLRAWFAIAALGWGGSAAAQTVIVGADWQGGDLLPADGDILEGVFTNVGDVVIEAGTRVYVQHGVRFELEARSLQVDGTLDGVGAGLPGGGGAPLGAFDGSGGQGPGRGTGGLAGPCVHGGGGGGGGHGGRGGDGSYYFNTGQGQGGPAYGDPEDTTIVDLGSGGGGGGSGCDLAGGDGGPGGGAMILTVSELTLDGVIDVSGGRGRDGNQWSGGGGGGSGGEILIDAAVVAGDGQIVAAGGNGGNTVQGIGGLAGGGGGGGGGRIKVLYGTLDPAIAMLAAGGQRGQDQAGGYALIGSGGQAGTTFTDLNDPDPDGDGVLVGEDNCPNDPNPDQADRDDDGVGDVCDVCPDDPVDADGDGVCDSVDICVGGDDRIDTDADGQPDACDCGPEDPLAQTDAIEACDGVDNDCNGYVDEPGAVGEADFFADLDGDGFGDPADVRRGCDAPLNFIPDGNDCNDDRPDAFPGSVEVCDGIDNDCDGVIDPDCAAVPESSDGCGCGHTPAAPWSIGLGAALLGLARRRARRP